MPFAYCTYIVLLRSLKILILTMKRLFLNDRFIYAIIVLNAAIIFTQEMGVSLRWLDGLDAVCTLIFTIEMVIKHAEYGVKAYWKNGWDRLDGTLVLLSIPSLVYYVAPAGAFNISFLLAIRLFRVFRFFRVFHLFPNFSAIVRNTRLALRQSFSVFVGFAIFLLVFAIISCAMFRNLSPEFFATPLESLYSIFRICTVEGWYEIPDAVAAHSPFWTVHMIRIYFIVILLSLGIIGMSIINSIFVDAMVSDNNDEVLRKLGELEQKIDALSKK